MSTVIINEQHTLAPSQILQLQLFWPSWNTRARAVAAGLLKETDQ